MFNALKNFILTAGILSLSIFVASSAFAQDASSPDAQVETEMPAAPGNMVDVGIQDLGDDFGDLDTYDLIYGAVKELQTGGVVISQYDEAMEQDVDVTYMTDDETTLDGVAALTDLKVGDEVEVMFQDVDGKKMVRLLTAIANMEMDEEYLGVPESFEAPGPEEQVIESEENPS